MSTDITASCLPGCHLPHPFDLGFRLCDAPVAELPIGDGRRLSVSVSRVVEDGQEVTPTVALGLVETDGTVRDPVELSADVAQLLAGALGAGAARAQVVVGLVA